MNPFPSQADLVAEALADERDVADLVTLRELRSIVARALDAAGRCDRIHHPDARWSTEDLLDLLREELSNIDGEADRIRANPGALEDE